MGKMFEITENSNNPARYNESPLHLKISPAYATSNTVISMVWPQSLESVVEKLYKKVNLLKVNSVKSK